MVGGFVAGSIGMLAALKLTPEARTTLLLTLTAAIIAVYGAQAAAIAFLIPPNKAQEVLMQRSDGVDAYPAVHPWVFVRENLTFNVDGQKLLPMSGISKVSTVYCNENGKFLVYTADRHGFLNPDSVWDGDTPHALLVGDSFTHGACVDTSQNIASILRDADLSAVSIGMGGNGPYLMMASAREYLDHVRPNVVVWSYFEGNDLFELGLERKNAFLERYLSDPSFKMDVWRYQRALDERLRERVEVELKKSQSGDWVDMALLRPLRAMVGLHVGNVIKPSFDPATADFELFKAVLRRARDDSYDRGIKFVFAYLPDHPVRSNLPGQKEAYRRVISIVRGLNIPLVDMRAAFTKAGDFEAMFQCENCHYGPAGYAAVGKAIADAVKSLKSEVK